MDRILSRAERYLARFAIPNLSLLIAGGMAIVYVLSLSRPSFLGMLTLDLGLVRRGQLWRLFTYLFIPDTRSPFWILLSIYWLWMVGRQLENEWGTFKFNAFYFVGMLGTTAAAWIAGGAVGNTWLNLTLLFAFTTLFPNFEILFFFVIPLRVKWLGLAFAAFQAYAFLMGDWATRGAIVAATSNYFLFFGGHLFELLRGRSVQVKQAARRVSLHPPPAPTGGRACALCGAKEDDGADIRVCTCEKCGGKPRQLCLEHARAH